MISEWRKSSRSGSSGSQSDCVEVARLSLGIGVRDSKNPQAGHLALERVGFAALLSKIKAGELDL